MLERYINGVIRWHKTIVVAVVLASGLLAAGMKHLEVDNDFRAFLDSGDSLLQTYDDFLDTYGARDGYVIVVVPGDGDIFSADVLTLIRELGLAARDIPGFDRVSSVAEVPFSPSLTRTAARAAQGDDEYIDLLRERVLNDPLLMQRYVAPGGRAAAVRIGVLIADEDARRASLAGAREVVAQVAAAHPVATLTLAGNIPVSEGLTAAITSSLVAVSAATGVLLLIALAVITRSLYATLATNLVMAFSVEATMGVVGWLGVKLTIVTGFVPAAIAALAVGDSMHLLVGYHAELRNGRDKAAALRHTVRHNARAIFLTSLTSIIGVLTLNFADAPPYRAMGNMIALGVAFAFVMSMLLWPALMAWFPAPKTTPRFLDTTSMARLGRRVLQHRKQFIVVVGALSLLLITQAFRNTLTERWHEYLGPRYEARVAIDTVTEYFGGIHHVYYSLDSGTSDGALDAGYLQMLDEFAAAQAGHPDVVYVKTLVDLLVALGVAERDDNGLTLQPKEAMLTLLEFTGSLGDHPGDSTMLDGDRSASVVEVTYRAAGSARLIAADDATRAWLADHAPQVQAGEGLGLDLVFSKINLANVHGMLKGAFVALLVISALLVFLLRSARLGLISLVPNLLPIGLAFGAWGVFVGEIDMAVSVVMGISLGIVVDDTVHFLCKYDAARKANSPDAVHDAYGRVATAIVTSSLVLIAGMSGALVADITPTRETALLMMTTIGFAMLADLLLLPPLLGVFDRRRSQARRRLW